MSLMDIAIAHAVYADNSATATANQISGELQKLISEVTAYLRSLNRPITDGDVRASLVRLASVAPAVNQQVRKLVADHLDTIARTTVSAFSRGLKSEGLQPIALDMQAIAAQFTAQHTYAGKPWAGWADKLVADTQTAIATNLRGSVALDLSAQDAAIELDSASRKAASGSELLSTTATTDISNGVRYALGSSNSGVYGWLYHAILDGRTSAICRGLAGNVYKATQEVPVPPRHSHCRSSLIPLSKADYDSLAVSAPRARQATPEELNAAVNAGTTVKSTGENRRSADLLVAKGKDVPDVSVPAFKSTDSYDAWLSRQPVDTQKEILGPSRYQTWKDGLPLASMATSRRPLTLDQLRQLYPDAMQ